MCRASETSDAFAWHAYVSEKALPDAWVRSHTYNSRSKDFSQAVCALRMSRHAVSRHTGDGEEIIGVRDMARNLHCCVLACNESSVGAACVHEAQSLWHPVTGVQCIMDPFPTCI